MLKRLTLVILVLAALAALGALLLRPVTTGIAPGQNTLAADAYDSLVVIPEDGVQPLAQLIDSARESVWVYVYMLSERRVVDGLKAAAGRGVDARVMLERDPFGATDFNDPVRDELSRAGVKVQWHNPAFKLSHQKVVLVDRRQALVATFNFVKTAFTTNREFGIITQDPAVVNDLYALFDADWQRTSFKPRSDRLVISPNNSRTKIVGVLRSARKVLYMEQLSLQDAEVVAEIANAARRGVEVKVIMSVPPSKSDPDARGRKAVVDAGGKVKFLAGLDVHAKVILSDDVLFVGSENLTAQSLDLNREVGLITTNKAAVDRFLRTFERDWGEAR